MYNRYYDSHASTVIDITYLSVSKYHRKYPTTTSPSQDPSSWKTLIKDLYTKFPDKTQVPKTPEKDKEESLHLVCATTQGSPSKAWPKLNKFDFCKQFAARGWGQKTPITEFNVFVEDFLRHDFRSEDIETRCCVIRHHGRGGLPEGFPQKLVELCSDTLVVVDFMETSAREPFISDLNQLLRNFCYHALVRDTAIHQITFDIWEEHSKSIYEAFKLLRNELDQTYGVIMAFLRAPQFNDDIVDEVLIRYLMTTAFLDIVLRGTADEQAAKKIFKGIKEAVEEVDACQRGTYFMDYARKTISNGICDRLLKGIRLVLQVQCVRDAQARSKSQTWKGGDESKFSAIENYQHLAKEGRKVLPFGRKEKIDKWIKKVDTSCGEQEAALLEATRLVDG